MNWKKIKDLDGLPEEGAALVIYPDGSFSAFRASEIRKGRTGSATHWAIIEPPKPLSDGDAFREWRATAYPNDNIHYAWNAALRWERSK